MFEAELKTKLQKIFKVKKVTFDRPGDQVGDVKVPEQECLFIDVARAPCNFKDKKAFAKVQGRCLMYGNIDKLPYGFFAKAITLADPELTRDFFFFDFEDNNERFVNLTERSFSFIYLFNGQFDPSLGNITSIEFQEESDE